MKPFTSILFGLVLVLGLSLHGQKVMAELSKEDCIATACADGIRNKDQSYSDCRSEQGDNKCKNNRSQSEIANDKKESKQACSATYKDWQTNSEKNGQACQTFMGADNKGESCKERVNNCRKQLTGSTAALLNPENDELGLNKVTDLVTSIWGDKNKAADTSTQKISVSGDCYGFSNEKTIARQDKQEEKIKQLKKDIADEVKKQREANEKLDKETNEVKVEQQKLQAETTKTLQKLDVEKREKLTKMNEELQKAGTDIRKQTTEIVKIKQAMEKLKFENQKTLMAYTEDKINQQCKSALDTAKVCFVKASKGIKFSKDDTCSNFSFSGSGTKGTAELKKRLQQVKEACFEQSNQTVSTLKYDYADKIRTYEMDIKEKQEQISDANKSLELKKTENAAITKETETQKSQEQKNLEEQMANFAEKLTALEKNVKSSVADSQAIIDDLRMQLDKATAIELSDDLGITSKKELRFVFDEADRAITSTESARAEAFEKCECDIKDTNVKICGVLRKSAVTPDKPAKAKSNTGTTK